MSRNLDYHDLWHNLYDWVKSKASEHDYFGPYDEMEVIMEEMDPRLTEEEDGEF